MKRSRRAVLAAGGVVLATVAGCSTLGLGDDTPAYDPGALAALSERALPEPPAVFPVAVPTAMIARHRNRARRLIEGVPEMPDIPNGAVAQRLQRERQEVLDELEGSDPDRSDPEEGPLDRLGEARHTRADAAAVAAAYRAATGDITADGVATRRERLWTDRGGFVRAWRYRGGDPAASLVIHRHLEDLLREVRQVTMPERAFPAEPAAAVFRVGAIVRRLEDGRAALTDAEGLRSRYLETVAEPTSFATALSVGSARLQQRKRRQGERLHEYVAPDADQLPFDRSLDGTALERLYREAAASVQRRTEEASRARRRGALATALLEVGFELTARRMFETIVTAIRDGDLASPIGVAEIESAQQRAIEQVETAWTTAPTVVAVTLTRPAYALLRRGTGDLSGRRGDDEVDSMDAHRAFASFVRAAHYAEAVPHTVTDLRDVYLSPS